MDTKICRICSKLSENYVHIFKKEELINKIETCLPIIVSPHCLLPDTICSECLTNVENFYSFIKNCLQNIIILEAQYDITNSCLKTKRKQDKGCYAEITVVKYDKNIQTDEDIVDSYKDLQFQKLNLALLNAHKIINDIEQPAPSVKLLDEYALVNYDVSSEIESENEDDFWNSGKVCLLNEKRAVRYFDDQENLLINEIAQRRNLKRKCETIESHPTKIFKLDRRKSKQPKKVEFSFRDEPRLIFNNMTKIKTEEIKKEALDISPQLCLLCDLQCSGPTALMAHIYEMHGIDMNQVISSEPVMERRKKIPNLVKIVYHKSPGKDNAIEEPTTLQPSFICPLCPAVLTIRSELFLHLRSQHPKQAMILCGLCLHIANSYTSLVAHLNSCRVQFNINSKYVCKICSYHDDNLKIIEDHISVHDFILLYCKKQAKVFDPTDYVEINSNCLKVNRLMCSVCDRTDFLTFQDFTAHRRSQHQIFQCDLCNKYYGRNSHLWKHVNRLHKGHPSITCELCGKTSASKYHLKQHFNKIHSAKSIKQIKMDEEENLMLQKVSLQNCIQQNPRKQEKVVSDDSNSDGGSDSLDRNDVRQDPDCSDVDSPNNADDYEIRKITENSKFLNSGKTKIIQGDASRTLPKEIDTSSDLYTNIITNYTPPLNEGEYKCPKCYKGFHKKAVLKKHKKNCRPRLQKDLLTRCKSCSRIFKDRQSLTKHLINYHSEYTCEICTQKVQSKCEIVSHIRFSHPNCHLVCHCGNILRNKKDLVEHKSDHLNSFVCQFCADILPTKIKLKMHVLSLHRKILSLSCGICLKLFETQHILRDHVRLAHKDELSPITSCTVCGKNYGSKWKTYDHLNKSHGRIFKPCKVCLDIFDTEAELQYHFDVAHNKINVVPLMKNESDGEVPEELEESEYSNDGIISDDEPNKIDDISSVDPARISLLEKRISGFNKTFEDISKKHNESVSSQNSSKRTVYVNSDNPACCEICFKTWPAKKHLWQHYIRCHKTIAATVCGICLKANSDYRALQIHLHETHPTLLHGQGFGSNFICRICGRYHNASSKLKLHMGIHENFDWSILDKNNTSETNGYLTNQTINYESLIERVECSSDSDSVSDDSEDDSQIDDEIEIKEENVKSEEIEISSSESGSSVSMESSVSDAEDAGDSKLSQNSNDDTPPQNNIGNIFSIKAEELDSAIRSISYEQEINVNEEFPGDIIDLQPHTLNPHELQSAVNSIL